MTRTQCGHHTHVSSVDLERIHNNDPVPVHRSDVLRNTHNMESVVTVDVARARAVNVARVVAVGVARAVAVGVAVDVTRAPHRSTTLLFTS
jgi:hypothetical protein